MNAVLQLFLAVVVVVGSIGVQGMRGVGRQDDGSTLIEWDESNPIFRIDNTEHVMDVRLHQQVHILCPKSSNQRYIIYNVNRDDYESCRISDPDSSTQVAVCNGVNTTSMNKRLFTLTFRTFSPSPTGLEFQAGKDYYFITTSGPGNIASKVGGRCRTHNMKVIFKVKGRNSERKSNSKFHMMNRKVHGRRQGDILEEEEQNKVRSSMFSRERFGRTEPDTMNGGRYEAYYPSEQESNTSGFRSRKPVQTSVKQEASRQHQKEAAVAASAGYCYAHTSPLSALLFSLTLFFLLRKWP